MLYYALRAHVDVSIQARADVSAHAAGRARAGLSAPRWWNGFLIVLVLYSAWASPFELALERAATTPLLVVDLVVDAFFAVDIAVSFSVAYFDRPANLFVDDRRKIATRCLTRPWFAMDVASTVPFHIIYRLVSGRSTGFRYLNLLRLWRLRRVSKLFARYPLHRSIPRIINAVCF